LLEKLRNPLSVQLNNPVRRIPKKIAGRVD